MIGYGVEAGTQRVLDLMSKNVTIADIERAVTLTNKAGIEVTGHVIVGYPGETKEDIKKTIVLMKRLKLDYIQVYCCVPFPGSPLYQKAKEEGLLTTADWTQFEQNFSVLNTPQLSPQDVMSLREKIIKAFYFSPSKIIVMLSKIRSWQEIRFFLSFVKNYFRTWVKAR